MKKTIFALIALITIGLLTSCTEDSEADFMQTTFIMTYDAQDNVYKIDGGEWSKTGQVTEFNFDRTIDDEITITATTVEFVSLKALDFPFEYAPEVNGRTANFYSADMYEYMDNTDYFYFQITLK